MYACNAGRIAINDGSSTGLAGLLTPMTNVRLNESIILSLKNPTNADILKSLGQIDNIKLQLMQGYGEYLNKNACDLRPIKPSRAFITKLHHTVFKENGADPESFGGSTVDNSWWKKLIIQYIMGYDWCPNCGE